MKAVISSLLEVLEALQSEYEPRDGKFHLKVEGDYAPLVEANTKLAEFRDNNRALNTKKTELEAQLAKFKDIDPAKYTEMSTKLAELQSAGVGDKNSVAELVKAAVKAAVEPLESKVREREQAEATARAQLQQQGLENALRDVGLKVGINEAALPDYVRRGLEVFKVVEGKHVARNGDAPIFSKQKPAEELGMEEWATTILSEQAPHLFKPSRGGGAGGPLNIGGQFGGQRKTISSDPLEFGRNLEGIAKGEVVVQQQ